MSNDLLDFSFGVKRTDGYVSDIWRASITRLGDFHLATSSIAGAEEYRFNKSGMCRSAHSAAEGAPEALRPRTTRQCCCLKWAALRSPIDRPT